ncbi:ABC transporter permease [Bacillus solimangrovi]|uniref:Cell division protein FtsX n=1 Tax=Bacillus solimangrovi TaxID=1305675 RepID=A0A1E5LAA3_9BACI|nr:ABC transporter permease [Bacillus solimangrovi]OEH91053.1 cell division protein FtsX [Bacillus solimangrovi]
MNIVNKLTIRHLKENKRRTLVTILGIIISVAMVTAVATLATSFMDVAQRNQIADYGEWHVRYNDVNQEQLEAIKEDEETKSVILSNDVGFAQFEESKNKHRPYFFVKAFNKEGFKQLPIKVVDGRLPKSTDEVVISKGINSIDGVTYDIGDQITMEVGERYTLDGSGPIDENLSLIREEGKSVEILKNTQQKTYTVVGEIEPPKWKDPFIPGYIVINYLDENLIGTNHTLDASVAVNKVNQSIYDYTTSFAQENKIQSVLYHTDLLAFYGVSNDEGLKKTMVLLTAIIIGVIIAGSVALIYNAFAISISERARHLGMLSSVGTTKKQKRNSVLFEGLIVGLISIPIGIIFGVIGIGITLSSTNSIFLEVFDIEEKLNLIVTPLSILIACGISIITIFISAYLPARKASKISAIDAIRQTQDVKLSGKKVKTSKLVRKLFGIQAEIGLKNLKRNKRRYQVTIFSLVISIVLFLTVSFFTDNMQKSIELKMQTLNDYDIQVGTIVENSDLLTSVSTLEDVTNYNIVKSFSLNTWIDEDKVPADSKQQYFDINDDGKRLYHVNVQALDEASFQNYAQSVNADVERFADATKPAAILIDTFNYKDREAKKIIESTSILAEPGMKIDLINKDFETEEETFVNSIEIASVAENYSIGNATSGYGSFVIIVPESLMEQLVPVDYKREVFADLFLSSSDPMKTQVEIEEFGETDITIDNKTGQRLNTERVVLLMEVFSYGFTILITAISVANIFNTISTSIALRKREFAMLKSIGMTPKEFNKMINYESIFYAIKSLLYGLPISIAIMYFIHRAIANTIIYKFTLPWVDIIIVIITIFMIVGAAMLYSSSKVKKENIIDALKMENI